ncbi:hypothetical protein VNO77_45144 [Canavalia gladiata]|uniref:Uncharacterized protein n=1 Tax=Canavalia gladiata TaxID=3824 RepID=A0AAN9PNS0_CANGL
MSIDFVALLFLYSCSFPFWIVLFSSFNHFRSVVFLYALYRDSCWHECPGIVKCIMYWRFEFGRPEVVFSLCVSFDLNDRYLCKATISL